MLILYNNNPIIHSLQFIYPRNNHLPHTYRLARGNAHFLRILCIARGNTHILATSVSPEENTHFPRTSHSRYVWRPQGFRSLPNSRPGSGKLPTRQFMSSLWFMFFFSIYTWFIHVYVHTYVCVYACVYVRVCMYISVCVSAYVFIYV